MPKISPIRETDTLRTFVLAVVLVGSVASLCSAHEPTHGIGLPGDPASGKPVSVAIIEGDDGTMRFEPASFHLKAGETVRFEIHNEGKLAHEFRVDTAAENKEHEAMMAAMPGMPHHEGNSVDVPAGATRRLAWRFTKAGTFEIACLIPGHYGAGMHGTVVVGR